MPLTVERRPRPGRARRGPASAPATCCGVARADQPRRPCPGRAGSRAPRRSRSPPRCARDGLRGGLLSWDGQLEDDARLVTCVARTAAAYGARRAHPGPGPRADRRRAPRCATSSPARRRDDRAPAPSSTPPASGPATSSTRSACGPSRGTHLVLRAEHAARPGRVAVMAPVPGSTQPLRVRAPPARRDVLRRPDRRAGRRRDPRRARADRGRDRLPARRGRRRPAAAAAPRRRRRGVRRAAAAARRRGRRPPTCRASTPCSPRAAAWSPSSAAS